VLDTMINCDNGASHGPAWRSRPQRSRWACMDGGELEGWLFPRRYVLVSVVDGELRGSILARGERWKVSVAEGRTTINRYPREPNCRPLLYGRLLNLKPIPSKRILVTITLSSHLERPRSRQDECGQSLIRVPTQSPEFPKKFKVPMQ
jgi:hypothetical protein